MNCWIEQIKEEESNDKIDNECQMNWVFVKFDNFTCRNYSILEEDSVYV